MIEKKMDLLEQYTAGRFITAAQVAILKAFTKPNKNYVPVAPSLVMTASGGAKEHGSSWATILYSAKDLTELEAYGLVQKAKIVWDDFWVLTDLGIACRRLAQ